MPHAWIPKHDNGLHVTELKGFKPPRFHAVYIADCQEGRDGGMVYQADGRSGLDAAARVLGMIPARCECPACSMAEDERDEVTNDAFRGLRLVGSATD